VWQYEAPLRDMRFVIERVLAAPASWAHCDAFADVDMDTAEAVLDQAARFASEVLLPLNAVGDTQGCRRDGDGRVHTPDGFAAAYRAFVDAGWPALPCDPQWGGQGLPLLVDAALREMLVACNHAWTMYPDLLHGAYETIQHHASDDLKATYLAKVATGEWLAAMALTEPGAGTDLGALRTKAEPQPDGTLRISGAKIFISGGDHDLTDNIVHLVLCRLHAPGNEAPPGTKGLSLALVPAVLPDGTRNAMHCDGLEHKMGIHGSATCAMRYDGATGWLVGAPQRGLAAMFVMMNSARLHVGLQGLGHQEMATQNALRYARERVQMGLPIIQHAAVRHLLLRAQAMTEGQRVLAYRAALAIDEAHHHRDAARREAAAREAALLTPLVKAFATHHGFHTAVAAQQVWGGYGYVRETGIEQTVRDARIAMVYEGTNEVQAIDLVQRKVLGDGGAALFALLDACEADAGSAPQEFAAAWRAQAQQCREATLGLIAQASSERELAQRVADDYLFALAHTLLAWAFAASARAAAGADDAAWAQGKTERMRYGVQWLLPQGDVHWARVRAGARCALPLPA
jgi:alkylation response protein AidB-like acyl-CoA dehydrogenase